MGRCNGHDCNERARYYISMLGKDRYNAQVSRYYISILGEDRYSAQVCIEHLILMLENAPEGTRRIVTVAIPKI